MQGKESQTLLGFMACALCLEGGTQGGWRMLGYCQSGGLVHGLSYLRVGDVVIMVRVCRLLEDSLDGNLEMDGSRSCHGQAKLLVYVLPECGTCVWAAKEG